jgi:SAM-dependent methyltransferase
MSSPSDLAGTTQICRLLSDPTRVRLLALLQIEPLSVAELTEATRLPQPRVSTHLRKLRQADIVEVHRVAGRSCYRLTDPPPHPTTKAMVDMVLNTTTDPLIEEDARRARMAVAARNRGKWLDGVAGRMKRHYSPGRTWEALARTIAGTHRLGRVADLGSGDGAVSEILAPFCEHIECVDNNPRIVSAGQERLSHIPNLHFLQADMHALPFPAASFDIVLVFGALQYTETPELVLSEAARVLRPGGRLVTSSLREHVHKAEVQPFGHVNFGFEPDALAELIEAAGLTIERCGVVAREKRTPHFEVVAATATCPTPEPT